MRAIGYIVLGFTLLLTACAENATVYRVIDGDTIEVILNGGTEETVRIIGIDTPEYEECFFEEAKTRLTELIAETPLTLVPQPGDNRDKYGRLLRYVYQGDTDIGLQMIEEGFAEDFPWFPHPRVEEYKNAEQNAQNEEIGLWKHCQQ